MSELSTSFEFDMSKKMPIAIEQIKETIVEYEKKIVESEKIISESKKQLKELTEASVGIPPRDNILYPNQEALRDVIENEEVQIVNYKYNIGARTVTLGHLMITLGNDMIDKYRM
jgi:hypothetical protein